MSDIANIIDFNKRSLFEYRSDFGIYLIEETSVNSFKLVYTPTSGFELNMSFHCIFGVLDDAKKAVYHHYNFLKLSYT